MSQEETNPLSALITNFHNIEHPKLIRQMTDWLYFAKQHTGFGEYFTAALDHISGEGLQHTKHHEFYEVLTPIRHQSKAFTSSPTLERWVAAFAPPNGVSQQSDLWIDVHVVPEDITDEIKKYRKWFKDGIETLESFWEWAIRAINDVKDPEKCALHQKALEEFKKESSVQNWLAGYYKLLAAA